MAIPLRQYQPKIQTTAETGVRQLDANLEKAYVAEAGSEYKAVSQLFSAFGEQGMKALEEYQDRRDEAEILKLNRQFAEANQRLALDIENEQDAEAIQMRQRAWETETRNVFENSNLSRRAKRKVMASLEGNILKTNMEVSGRIAKLGRQLVDNELVDVEAAAERGELVINPAGNGNDTFGSTTEQYEYAINKRIENGTLDYETGQNRITQFRATEQQREQKRLEESLKAAKEAEEQRVAALMAAYRVEAAENPNETLGQIRAQKKAEAFLAKLQKQYGDEWESKATEEELKQAEDAKEKIKFELTSKELSEFQSFVKGEKTFQSQEFVNDFWDPSSVFNQSSDEEKLSSLQTALSKDLISGDTYQKLYKELTMPTIIEDASPKMIQDFVSLTGQITAANGDPKILGDIRSRLLTTKMPKSLLDSLVRLTDNALEEGPVGVGMSALDYAGRRIDTFVKVNAKSIAEDFKPRMLGMVGVEGFTEEMQKDVALQVQGEMLQYITTWYGGERAEGRTPTFTEIDSKLNEFMSVNYINANMDLINLRDGVIDIGVTFDAEAPVSTATGPAPVTREAAQEQINKIKGNQ